MAINITDAGADPSGAVASLAISTALQAQVQTAETTDVEALFSSLGLGANSDSLA